MAQSVNSLKVKAGTGRSTRDQSFDHVSTIDFNVVKPMGCFELVPGDHINIRPEVWMRTQAMNVPTFGKMDVITRAFFVPLRLCWKHYNDFYRQNPTGVSGLLNQFASVPRALMHDLSNEFLRRFRVTTNFEEFYSYNRSITNMEGQARRLHFGLQVQHSAYETSGADFTQRSGAAVFLYKFNPIGKRVFDFFNSLGYRWQFFTTSQQTSTNKGSTDNMYFVSVLPLLGWLRMFTDWYCPAEFKYLFSDVVYDTYSTVWDSDDIKRLFDQLTWAVYIYFNDDIFSMCENLPYKKGNSVRTENLNITQITAEPNSLLSRALEWHNNTIVADHGVGARINDFTSESGSNDLQHLRLKNQNFMASKNNSSASQLMNMYYQATVSGTNVGLQAGNLNEIISHWTVNGVMRAAQWLQRNNLLSSRLTEYLNAKFGVTPTAARLDQAEYIGHAGAPVRISDIAGTTEDNLGQLGAKGTSYSIDKFGYTAEEFGYIYFTVELRPRIGYGQGVDPLVLRTRLDEFYNQEFDSLGFEPVPTECLVSGPLSYHGSPDEETVNNGSTDNRIFGYLPRLWSYKCKHDMLSGDFMTPQQSFDGDLQSYHLMRTVDGNDLENFIHNSLSFRYAGLSVNENKFERIFRSSGSTTYDHFQLIVSFDAETNGLPLALNESWQVNSDHDEREGHLTNIQASL